MRKLIVLSLSLLITAQLVAQEFDLGIKAGVNFSSLADASGLNNQTGFVGGAFVAFPLDDQFAIQVDALYSQQGADIDLGKFDLDYITLPVVLKFYIVDRFNIQGGPQFGVLLNDDTQVAVGEIVNDIAVNDFDFAWVAGAGLDLPFGLRVDGRYGFGLTKVPDSSSLSSGRNSVVTLAVGWAFL